MKNRVLFLISSIVFSLVLFAASPATAEEAQSAGSTTAVGSASTPDLSNVYAAADEVEAAKEEVKEEAKAATEEVKAVTEEVKTEGKAVTEAVKKDGKCGEGKCGGDKAAKKEGKCGEGKCGS